LLLTENLTNGNQQKEGKPITVKLSESPVPGSTE